MKKLILTTKSNINSLPSIDSKVYSEIYGKGWSYSYVYDFTEIKDVFQVLRLFGKFTTLPKFTAFFLQLDVHYKRVAWNERKILEILNALKNFGLIDSKNNIIKDNVFVSRLNMPLYEEDLLVFKVIFFSYVRFLEMHTWFVNPDSTNIIESVKNIDETLVLLQSKPIFSISLDSRFTDTIFYDLTDNPTLYKINKSNLKTIDDEKIRFWDVYVSWGINLKLIEKINLKSLGISMQNTEKSIQMTFFVNKDYNKFDLLDFIELNYKSSYISIVHLIFKIVVKFRFSIADTKVLITTQVLSKPKQLRFQRTSEAFVKEINDQFRIMVKGSYVSHILVL